MIPSLDDHACAWRGPELAARSTEWMVEIDELERDELERAMDLVRERPLGSIDRDSAPTPRLARRLASIRRELKDGRGFVLLRGVPVAGRTVEQLARAHWLIGRHLGDPVAQNPAQEMLCHVRDTGADPEDHEVRLYTTRAEQDFHTDGADLIGLLCVHGARAGGLSRIVSSVRVFEEVRRRRPDLAPLLFEPWPFRLPGMPAGAPRHFELPIARWDGRSLASFFIGWYIRRSAELPEAPRLDDRRRELLDLYETTANDPSLYLDMEFRPGDVQWLKNSVILHKRTEYEDWPEPDRKRHLLRLWLAARDFPDGDDRLRDGMAGASAD
jgi:hypothetical protein